jgi:hypothetical protein
LAEKTKDENNFQETVKKAEYQALSKALARVAIDLSQFLDQTG